MLAFLLVTNVIQTCRINISEVSKGTPRRAECGSAGQGTAVGAAEVVSASPPAQLRGLKGLLPWGLLAGPGAAATTENSVQWEWVCPNEVSQKASRYRPGACLH